MRDIKIYHSNTFNFRKKFKKNKYIKKIIKLERV